MNPAFLTIQIVFGVLLILAILIQQKGSGIGSTFGGESGMYRTRRGAEKLVFRSTIVLSVLFITSIILGFIS